MNKILREDLHMRKKAAQWVPHALTEQQKWCRYETCRIHLEMYQNGANLLNALSLLMKQGSGRMNLS